MIGYLKGEVAAIYEDRIIIEVGGIGYNVFMPGSSLDLIDGIGISVKVYTYLSVREDAMTLYGFLTKDDLDLYKMLITVSQRTSDISIFFRVYSFKYNLPKNLFKNSINRLIIYGFTKMTVRKITIMNKNGRKEIDKSQLIISQVNDILTIPNIAIPLNMDTKILIV